MTKTKLFLLIISLVGHLAAQEERILRQEILRPVVELVVEGKTAIEVRFDTANFIDVMYDADVSNPLINKSVSMRGMTLIVCDEMGVDYYCVHIRRSDLASAVIDTSCRALLPQPWLPYVRLSGKSLYYSAEDNTFSPHFSPLSSTSSVTPDKRSLFGESLVRSRVELLWAFHDWGDRWYNGFGSGEGRGPRCSFSSWQLQWQYALFDARHCDLMVGVGYEWDLYKNVDNRTHLLESISSDDYDSPLFAKQSVPWLLMTRFNTHYLTFPISVGCKVESLRLSLTLLPGLATRSKSEVSDRDYSSTYYGYDMTATLNPVKFDVRLQIEQRFLGIFIQFATVGMLSKEGSYYEKVFPIKAGFSIKI